ncbi:hypothetical protein [Lentzea fradiae]|uniref:hypothetical protein n=1 Tax=Lentzea fradiae TaxID=200378 RepID=UPI000B7C6E2E|nr:hypothetical protein [Lentzea fradiae]
MTWQDELQKLDNELASGRISADDYRRRRDEVLSGSAGGGPAQNPQSGPFAPPFKWEAQPPATSDRTQVVNVQGQQPPQQQVPPQQNPSADATQVVPGGQRGGADAERTQFVTPVPPQQGGWGPPPQQAAPPPWLGGDFDQINQPPSWSHGPEVFDESGGGGKGKIFAIIGVVLVLALVGGGVWWFTSGSKAGGDNNATSAPPTTPPPTTSTSAGPKLPLAGLPGKVDPANTGPLSVERAAKEKTQFSPDEGALLTACGAEDGVSQVLFADDWFTQVHTFDCKDGASAATAAEAMAELQKTYGFIAGTGPKQLPAMISERAIDVPDAPFDSRVYYVSGKTLVRVEVRARTKEAMDSGSEKVVNHLDKNYPSK